MDLIREIQAKYFKKDVNGYWLYKEPYVEYEDLNKCFSEIRKLEQENKELKEVLEFYADESNWNLTDSLNNCLLHNGVPIRYGIELDDVDYHGGKKAREFLNKLNNK